MTIWESLPNQIKLHQLAKAVDLNLRVSSDTFAAQRVIVASSYAQHVEFALQTIFLEM